MSGVNQGLQYKTYPWQTKEVCITMRAPLRTVDLVQMGQGELETGCQTLDTRPKFTGFKRRELVEQRLNNSRIQNDHDELEGNAMEGVS